MPWVPDIFIPLDPEDPRNLDRHNPLGDRIRLRLNREGGAIVDFVVQYETPVEGYGLTHEVVIRSDGTHAPHYAGYDYAGRMRTVPLPAHLSPKETIKRTVGDIKQNWISMRESYFEEHS